MILKNGKRVDGIADALPIGSVIEYNGTDIPDGWEVLPEGLNIDNSKYETQEHRIGTWIDGKPLYRRVITTYATVESEKEFKIAHGVSDWDKMWIDLGNSFYYEAIRKRSLPIEQTFYTSASSTDMCHAFVEGDYVYIVSRGGWGEAWLKTITLNYTKNTD